MLLFLAYGKDFFSDVTVIVNNCIEFNCHRVVLSARSQYFSKLLENLPK